MKRLYFVRHGQSEMNVSGHYSGRIETPLTSTGVSQAKATGKNLKQKNLKIDLIVCSPLSRAHHTAKLIAKELDYPKDKIQLNELFVERSFGDMEGVSWAKFMEKDMDDVKNAETVAELHDRAIKAFEYLNSLNESNVLVVSHGSIGRALYRVINGMPYHLEHDEKYRNSFRIANAEIIELI